MAAEPLGPITFRTDLVAIGQVRIRPESAHFKGERISGVHGPHVSVPRFAFRLHREGCEPFLGTPNHAVFGNRNQRFRRFAVDTRGEHNDSIWVRPDQLAMIAARHDPSVNERPDAPFPFVGAPIRAGYAMTLRALNAYAESCAERAETPDPLAMEETVITLLDEILADSYAFTRGGSPRQADHRPDTRRAYRDAAEFAVGLLAADPSERWTIERLADRVHIAPLHFCRIFKRHTGRTVRSFQLGLRVSLAVELLEAGERVGAAAEGAGFCSASHLSDAMVGALGVRPTVASELLRGGSLSEVRSLMERAVESGRAPRR